MSQDRQSALPRIPSLLICLLPPQRPSLRLATLASGHSRRFQSRLHGNLCKDKGIEFVVVLIPEDIQVDPKLAEAVLKNKLTQIERLINEGKFQEVLASLSLKNKMQKRLNSCKCSRVAKNTDLYISSKTL